ncbi:MAG TPA: PilZ domain-containing protein [Phycisphaeraceae bacterium]
MSSRMGIQSEEHRGQPRLRVPAMYTLLRVRPAGASRYCWTGHIYDISLTGMRFELDAPLEPGTRVEVRGMLPGMTHTLFRATGRIIRLHEDTPDVVPVRMGMTLDQFQSDIDRLRLADYLSKANLRAA